MSLPTVSTSTRIGWIGLGVMGVPMCGHLLRQGYPVTVFTRTPSKAAGVLSQGAKWVTSPLGVAEASEVVFTMVGLLGALGRSIVRQGGPGMGQQAKLCNQIVIAGTMVGVCESLVYGYKAGLNLETMLASITTGAAACWTLSNLAPRILRRDFT